MNDLEKYALEQLNDFLLTADRFGLSYIGMEMEEPMQKLILAIVCDYVEEHRRMKNGKKENV